MEKLKGYFHTGRNGTPSSTEEKEISAQHAESHAGQLVDTPVRMVTGHSLVMALFVSMGGFLFGYDTGQISGILAMKDFLRRFGDKDETGNDYHFTNVRSGLIVALVSCFS